jgi:hypothetical protein
MDGARSNGRQRREHRRRRRYPPGVVAPLLVLLAGGLVGAAPTFSLLGSATSRLPWSTQPSACPSTHVAVLAVPDISSVVHQLVAPLDGRRLPDGSCLVVDLDDEQPAATAAQAASNPMPDLPQVWVPDSSLWISQARTWPVQAVGSLATSPVILAGRHEGVDALGWSRRPPTWRKALDPSRVIIAPGVTDDAALLTALLAIAAGQRSSDAFAVVAPSLLAATRAPTADLAAAIPLAQTASPSAPLILTTEQRLRRAMEGRPGPALVSVVPTGAPAVLDYPVTRVRPRSEDPVVAAGADLVTQALEGPASAHLPPRSRLARPQPPRLSKCSSSSTGSGPWAPPPAHSWWSTPRCPWLNRSPHARA